MLPVLRKLIKIMLMDTNSLKFPTNHNKTASSTEQKTLVQIATSLQNCSNKPIYNQINQHYLKIVNHHGMTIKLWECRICGSEFRHQYMLKRHLPGHTDERNYHCTICQKSFRQLSTLTQHKAIHSQARPHTCSTCKKTFNRISTLISHRKTHTDEKPFKCTMCNKGFHQKGNLRNHLYSHTNERPYRCGICNKGFNQQSNLTCHLKKVHGFVGKVNHTVKPKWEEEQSPKSTMEHSTVNGYVNSASTILVDEIRTPEMDKILQHNQVPFALLRHENNRPVLVRIYTASSNDGKHMLVPVTSTDLMSRGELIIGKQENDPSEAVFDSNDPLLHLHIPLAAILESKISPEGMHTMTVHAPSKYSKDVSDNIFDNKPTEKNNQDESYIVPDFDNIKSEYTLTEIGKIDEVEIKPQELKVVFGSESRMIPFSPDESSASTTRDPIMNYSQVNPTTQHSVFPIGTSSVQQIKHTDSNSQYLNPFGSSQHILDFPGLPSFSTDYNDIQLFDNLDCMESFCKKI